MAVRIKRRRYSVETLETRRVLASVSILPTEDGEVIDTAPIDQIWDSVDTTSALIAIQELHPINTSTDATRGVIEFDLNSIPVNDVDTAVITLDFSTVQTIHEIGIYAYAGDGQVTTADAGQLTEENLHTVLLGSDIVFDPNEGFLIELDFTDKVDQLLAAGESYMTVGLRAQSQGHGWRILAIDRPDNDTPRLDVTYTETNTAPVIEDASFFIDENVAANTPVGKVTIADPGDTFVVEFIAGNTDDAFAIDDNGNLTVNNAAAIDFESTPVFILTAQVTDSGELSDTATITVNLNDLPDDVPIDEQIQNIAQEVRDLEADGVLTSREARPILKNLEKAFREVDRGKDLKAIRRLDKARDEIVELLENGELTTAQANPLIAAIDAAISQLQE